MVDGAAARVFVFGNARLLEVRLFQARFAGGSVDAVRTALAAYQNDDGGFGHGLEPDKRTPASQPLDVEIAVERLAEVGAEGGDLALRACDFLGSVSSSDGAVPVLLPTIVGYPRAAHWAMADAYEPALNPTAAIAGHLHALGVDHPWLDRATEWCFATLEAGGPPGEAHTITCVTRFLAAVPDTGRAGPLAGPLGAALPASAWYRADADDETYGLTPLDIAPTPDSPWRSWFSAAQIETHLDRLERDQQPDGGWPLAWEPPSPATTCEWRAIKTIHALTVLRAHGRIGDAELRGPEGGG